MLPNACAIAVSGAKDVACARQDHIFMPGPTAVTPSLQYGEGVRSVSIRDNEALNY